jgi:hypothetical protein
MAWRKKSDFLYRGDAADAVFVPVPAANPSIVRHILYLDGYGRDTPYSSTSERKEVAVLFGARGGIWITRAPLAEENSVTHIDNKQLLGLLTGKGKGKGKGKWPNAYEVLQAKKYAEQHYEHLLDFSSVTDAAGVIRKIFSKA